MSKMINFFVGESKTKIFKTENNIKKLLISKISKER
jgi:hypothetical protein